MAVIVLLKDDLAGCGCFGSAKVLGAALLRLPHRNVIRDAAPEISDEEREPSPLLLLCAFRRARHLILASRLATTTTTIAIANEVPREAILQVVEESPITVAPYQVLARLPQHEICDA